MARTTGVIAGSARVVATVAAPYRAVVTGWLPGIVTVWALVTLGGGLVGALPARNALAFAIGLAAACHAGRLIRLALKIHIGQQRFGPCRGAGFLGMGVLVGGATAVTLAVLPAAPVGQAGPGGPVALGGLVATTVMYLLGLLLLPGAAITVTTRVRRLLDGIAVGTCLFYTAWLLFIAPLGNGYPLALVAGLVACSAASVALITGLRAIRYRPAAITCSGGATLSIVGLSVLVVVLTDPAGTLVLTDPALSSGAGTPTAEATGLWWAAAAALIVGSTLAAAGARRTGIREPDPATVHATFAGHPLLILPVGAAVLATAYRLITSGVPDRTSMALSAAAVAAVATREALAALDVRRYALRLASREAHFRSLVAGSSDVTAVVDNDLVVRWLSPAAARQLALSEQDVIDRPFTRLVHPGDVDRVVEWLSGVGGPDHPEVIVARLRDGYGCWRDTESTVSDQRATPEVAALVVHVRDISDRREMERTLRRLTFTDQLTGLANRRELLEAIDAGRSQPQPTGSVLVIALDGLGGVNDVRGRDHGDAILIEVGHRLRAGVDTGDLAARLSGERFAVLTPVGVVRAYSLATRLLTMLTEPYRLPGVTVHLSASIGLALITGADGVDDVLRRADLALLRAQRDGRDGRGRVEWYDESMEAALLRGVTLEQELPGAVGRGELDLVYQPILELAYQRPVGAEALLRWRHPTIGTVAPTELIAVAEKLGLVDEIGDWVLHRACRQLSGWLREGFDLWMSVNVSPRQLLSANFVPMLRDALDTHLVCADHLLLEITEQAAATPLDLDGLENALTRVREVGVRTAIDHFGTGPTSLAQLRRMAVDMVKVDRSLFAEPAGRGGAVPPIMDVVVGLGERLGLIVVASGVEAEAHLDAVRAAGCRYGQGTLFAVPAPPERIEAYLADYRSPSF
jgi:diguanylate cyclase (GGDEF)-like protein/PAS domain S-box-containing protein